MIVINRAVGQRFVTSNGVIVEVLKDGKGGCTLGIVAPQNVSVAREELVAAVKDDRHRETMRQLMRNTRHHSDTTTKRGKLRKAALENPSPRVQKAIDEEQQRNLRKRKRRGLTVAYMERQRTKPTGIAKNMPTITLKRSRTNGE